VTSIDKYAGFLDHIQEHLGTVQGHEPATVGGGNRGFAIFFCQIAEEDAISAVTNGLRFQRITTVMPQEIVCTLSPEQRQHAHFITALTAQLVIKMGAGLTYDQIIPSPAPLVEGSEIGGVVAMPHPYADDEFDILLDEQGQMVLQFVTLVPITKREIAYAEEHGADALFAVWEEQETDTLNVFRSSAV
jgi:hypothetical protein